VSDFYRRRRLIIKDSTALLTFFLGFVWSGAFVWPFMADQIDRGDMIRGLAYFLSAVLATAIVCGALGLEAGNLLGSLWERYHKQHRPLAASGGSGTIAWGGPARLWNYGAALPHPVSRVSDVSNVYYTQAGVYTASYIPLAERVRPMQYEARKVRSALARTTNIGAWDGARLVGVVRVLSDGYTFSAIADILVDPEYQRRGIGRSLMQHALAVTADSRLSIAAQPHCIGFFERVGCERGSTGFLMTEAASQ
jgi:GNAT superfamily N-acetyltransferase